VPWPDFAGAARLRARGRGGRQGEVQAEEELTTRLMKVISVTNAVQRRRAPRGGRRGAPASEHGPERTTTDSCQNDRGVSAKSLRVQ
jgi:hypothetical protein